MNNIYVKKFTIMITILSMIIVGVTVIDLNTPTFAMSNDEFDSSKLSNQIKANDWQIVSGRYNNEHYEYGTDNGVRVQKNVISTDVENKFQMLLNIEPQLTWDEVMQMNTVLIGNNASGQINKQTVFLYPDKGNRLHTATLVYYEMIGGLKKILSSHTMYHNGKLVSNGYVSFSNKLLGGKFKDPINYNFSGNNDRIEINISNLRDDFSFLDFNPSMQNVNDQMGDYINFNEVITADGTTQLESGNSEILKWNIANKDTPLEYVRDEQTGLITPIGVEKVLLNDDKITYYRSDYYRMLYEFTLDVEHKDFKSYQNYEANKEAKVTYTVGNVQSSAIFEKPVVRGLLYDLNINKIDSESKQGLEGAEFTFTKGNNYTKQISDENGKVQFLNNRTGTYSLEEVKAPLGYKILGENPVNILMNYTQLILVDNASGEPGRNQREHYELTPITIENEMEFGIIKIKKKVISPDPLGEGSYQVQIRGTTNDGNPYQQDIVIKNGEEVMLMVPKGEYTINEIVPMEYTSSIDYPKVTISPSNYEQFTTITNTFTHVGYFHDEDSKENIFKAVVE